MASFLNFLLTGLFIFAPVVVFRLHDFIQFRRSPDYELERERFRSSYWAYSTVEPRNPKSIWILCQFVWAVIAIFILSRI